MQKKQKKDEGGGTMADMLRQMGAMPPTNAGASAGAAMGPGGPDAPLPNDPMYDAPAMSGNSSSNTFPLHQMRQSLGTEPPPADIALPPMAGDAGGGMDGGGMGSDGDGDEGGLMALLSQMGPALSPDDLPPGGAGYNELGDNRPTAMPPSPSAMIPGPAMAAAHPQLPIPGQEDPLKKMLASRLAR